MSSLNFSSGDFILQISALSCSAVARCVPRVLVAVTVIYVNVIQTALDVWLAAPQVISAGDSL